MKRSTCFFAAIAAVIFLSVPVGVFAEPDWVTTGRNESHRRGYIAGAGSSGVRSTGLAQRTARSNAQADIAEQLGVLVGTALQQAETALLVYFNLTSFELSTEVIDSRVETAAEAMVRGARTVRGSRCRDTNDYWMLLEIPQSVYRAQAAAVVENIVQDIQGNIQSSLNQQPAATRPSPLDIHRSFANDAIQRMDEALDRHFRN